VLRHEAGEVRGRAERTAVDLGQPEGRVSAAITMSAFPTRPTPPPRQYPFTAAMTGTAHS